VGPGQGIIHSRYAFIVYPLVAQAIEMFEGDWRGGEGPTMMPPQSTPPPPTRFLDRHLGTTGADLDTVLTRIGARSLEDLAVRGVPATLPVPAPNRCRHNLLGIINAGKFFDNGRSWLFQILIVIEMEFNLLLMVVRLSLMVILPFIMILTRIRCYQIWLLAMWSSRSIANQSNISLNRLLVILKRH